MSRVSRITVLLAVFFGIDKIFALVRQLLISRQFGFSPVLDAFNAANNIPDLLYAMISGGALAIAFIPVLAEVLSNEGRKETWLLFSRIANLAFLVTGVLSILVALFSENLVGWELGIAPGFSNEQQVIVVRLMRLNLIATLIFSISGLVMAGLQANQHFLLPALSPILYNLGQIFGVLILAPETGHKVLGFQLPAFNLGVDGLVYGVILGALLHLGIQLPGLIRFSFRWYPSFGWNDKRVLQVFRVLGPRFLSMFFIQLIFIIRDNLASRLETGAVSALAYGWMIQQLPETLIGTAIGTALLPTLSELIAKNESEAYRQRISNAVQVLIALTIPVAFIFGIGLEPLIPVVFGLSPSDSHLLVIVTRGYLVGLTGHCLLEVAARSLYAQQNAKIPLLGSFLNLVLYLILGTTLYQTLGVVGISLTDSISYTVNALVLLFFLSKLAAPWFARWKIFHAKSVATEAVIKETSVSVVWLSSTIRALAAGIVGSVVSILILRASLGFSIHPLIAGSAALLLGALSALPIIWVDVRKLINL